MKIRSRRECVRLRTLLVAAPFLVSGVAFTSLGIPQQLPGVVATDVFEQAMEEQVSVPTVDTGRQASIPTTLLWILAFGVVASAIGGAPERAPTVGGPKGGDVAFLGAGAARSDLDDVHDAAAVSDVEEGKVVHSRPKKTSKPPEALKLPPHVVALLEKSAAARAAGRAALPGDARGGLEGGPGFDVTLPSYDPWRDDD